jgi:TetR/AcrR family transcriptional regulator
MSVPKSKASRPRSEAKRALIVDAAMRHFARNGYEATRIEDIAAELRVAKGSIFQHFGNKEGLFLAAYKKAASTFSPYLDVPPDVQATGFFETVRYWLVRTEHFLREDWVPYRVALLGNYSTDLNLKREINRFLVAEDPCGTTEFVRWGIERGEVRTDVDEEMIVSIVVWTVERFQDALLTEELDPGLFRRGSNQPERMQGRIEQFLEVLRSAIGTGHARAPVKAKKRSAAKRPRTQR